MELLTPTQFAANDHEDMVIIRLGSMRVRVTYQTAFEAAQALRLACKGAARHDRAAGHFWPDVDTEDMNDCPPPHRGFRRSHQVPNVKGYRICYQGAEVALLFDGEGVIVGYEDGIRLHQMIRRAGRRAKAWAGDDSKRRVMMADLTDASKDYQPVRMH